MKAEKFLGFLNKRKEEKKMDSVEEIDKVKEAMNSIEDLEKVLEQVVKPGSVIYIPGNNAQMKEIHQALRTRLQAFDTTSEGFRPPVIYQLLSADPALYDVEGDKARFVTPFAGAGMRNGARNINNGGIELMPMHLSDVPLLHLENPESEFCPDVAIVQVSPPDEYGNYSLGEGGIAISAIRGVKERGGKVVAVINKNCPQFGGSCNITKDEMDVVLNMDVPVSAHGIEKEPEEWERGMASHIVDKLRDGDILQLGIGSIPPLVLQGIKARHDKEKAEGKEGIKISIFSEVLMVNKYLRELIESGIVTGDAFEDGPGISKCGIPLFATEEDAKWLKEGNGKKYISVEPQGDMNSRVKMNFVKKAGRLISVNAGLCASIDGTVAAHTIGKEGETTYFSGFGGAIDFNQGADVSFVCIHSTRTLTDKKTGKKTTVCNFGRKLPDGAMVTYTPSNTDYIVTERGIAKVRGKTLQQRFESILDLIPKEEAQKIAQDVLAHADGPNTSLVHVAKQWIEKHEPGAETTGSMQMAA